MDEVSRAGSGVNGDSRHLWSRESPRAVIQGTRGAPPDRDGDSSTSNADEVTLDTGGRTSTDHARWQEEDRLVKQTFTSGDHVGTYRIIGTHPGGGYRAVDGGMPSRPAPGRPARVRIEVAEHALDWRARAVQLLRASSLLSGFDHPGIAQIVGRGVLSDPANPRPWVASELADGVPLSEILARRTLAVDETLDLVRDIASILSQVHDRGLAHDALQAHAITMRTGARDFPLQLGGWSELRADAEPVGAGDIHALGVLAFRALTGKSPGLQPPELIAGVPGVAGALIIRMLAIDPEARPDAADVARDVAVLTGNRALSGPRFARPRWTPQPSELQHAAPIILATKRVT